MTSTQDPIEAVSGLIERIEAAVGPDRELDRDIMIAVVPCDRAPFRYWAPVNENTGYGGVDVERVYYAPHCAQAVAVPHFTASIDAAMSLVPDGMLWMLTNTSVQNRREPDFTKATALVSNWQDTDIDETEAATPALALCAAALKAKAMETQSATTAGRGPKDESAVPQGFAQPTGSIKGGDRG